MSLKDHVYRVDCSALSPAEYEKVYAACDKLAFFCAIVPGRPRCFDVTWTLAEPFEECLSLPKACKVHQIL